MQNNAEIILENQYKDKNLFITLIVALCFILLMPIIGVQHTIDYMIFCIYVLGYNILYGFLGRLSFGHMLYFGIGAYAGGLFARYIIPNPLLAMLVSLSAGALIGLILGPIIMRTTGACFALINLAFNKIGFFLAAVAFDKYTGGEDGFPVRYIKLDFLNFYNKYVTFFFVFICLLMVFYILKLLTGSSFGLIIKSIKEDERRVKFLGYNTYNYKLIVFIISTTITALAGFLTTINYGYVTTGFIDPNRNVEVIFAVLIGGADSLYGALLGGVIYMGITNYLAIYIARWEMFLGIILLILALKFKKGIWGYLEIIKEKVIKRG